jgi:ketosteroid isomerase-like protein
MGILLLIVLALQSAGPAPSNNDPFVGLRNQWASDLHAKHIEDSLAQYAADADFVSDAGRAHGTDALRSLFQNVTATLDSDLTFTSERVEVSGDLAYDSGTYTETLVTRATGTVQHLAGSYLTVYRRTNVGGSGNAMWLIVEQVWTGGEVRQ